MRKIVLIVALLCFARVASAQVQIQDAITASNATCAATTPSACVTLPLPAGQLGGASIQIYQTYSATLQFEGTTNGVTWVAVPGTPAAGGTGVTSTTTTGVWKFDVTGLSAIRVRCSAFSSGQAGVYIQGSLEGPTGASAGGGTITVVQPTMSSGVSVALGALSGSTNVALYADPCDTSPGLTVSGSISTSTLIISGTAAKVITICSGTVYVNGTATNWALVSGSGGSAAAPTNATANWMGGTTASAGPNFIANQGIVSDGPRGKFTQAVGQTGYNLYLLLSAANQVNYNFRYVVQ